MYTEGSDAIIIFSKAVFKDFSHFLEKRHSFLLLQYFRHQKGMFAVCFDKSKRKEGVTQTLLKHMMFPSLECSSFQGVLLVEDFALKLVEERSLLSFDTLASHLIETHWVFSPRVFTKICCKIEKQVRIL